MLVDSHVHFWHPDELASPFITKENLGPALQSLHRPFLPPDLVPHLHASEIEHVVLVNSGNSHEDNVSMLNYAADNDWIGAVIGSLPIWDHAEERRLLKRYAPHGRFRGIRPLEAEALTSEDWFLRPENIEGLRILSGHGCVLEVLADSSSVRRQIPELAEALPELTIILNHLAAPPIRDGDSGEWSSDLAAAANFPNVYAKVSEILDHTRWPSWTNWTSDDFQAYLDVAIDLFGADRLMFGSGWPGVTLVGGYDRWWAEVHRALANIPSSEVEAIMGTTAVNVYGIKS